MSEFTYNTEGAIERMRELVAARVPFLHQGRDFNGIDCVGGLAYAFQFSGYVPDYPEDPINGELEQNLRRVFGAPVLERASTLAPVFTASQLQPVQVVSMQYKGPVRHVALVAPHVTLKGQLSVIHTDAMLGRVTEHIFDAKWLRRTMRVWQP